jgi:Holliday junction resolvase
MSINSRNKGKRFELECAKALKELGFIDARRSQQYCGGLNSADVVGIDDFHIECKIAKDAIRLSAAWEQINKDKGDNKGLLMWRTNGEKIHIDLLLEDLLDLIEQVLKVQKQKAS